MNWQQPTRLPPLHPGDIHLWRVAWSPDWEHEDLQRWLDTDERQRLKTFKAVQPARMYLCARVLLRRLLTHYLNCPANELRLAYTDRGKPYLPSSTLHFNLSHSHHRACIALTHTQPLGIDIEHINHRRDLHPVAQRYFAPAEQQQLTNAKQPADTFYTIWTRKEAYLKATGHGIATRLAAIDTTADHCGDHQLHSFNPAPDYRGAIAHAAPAPTTIHPWSASTDLLHP